MKHNDLARLLKAHPNLLARKRLECVSTDATTASTKPTAKTPYKHVAATPSTMKDVAGNGAKADSAARALAHDIARAITTTTPTLPITATASHPPPLPVAAIPVTSVCNNLRFEKIAASVLKTISGCTELSDDFFAGKYVRRVVQGQVDDEGKDISGFFVVSDTGAVLLFNDAANARRWANDKNKVNIENAPSLTYVDSGNPQVRLLKFTNICTFVFLVLYLYQSLHSTNSYISLFCEGWQARSVRLR